MIFSIIEIKNRVFLPWGTPSVISKDMNKFKLLNVLLIREMFFSFIVIYIFCSYFILLYFKRKVKSLSVLLYLIKSYWQKIHEEACCFTDTYHVYPVLYLSSFCPGLLFQCKQAAVCFPRICIYRQFSTGFFPWCLATQQSGKHTAWFKKLDLTCLYRLLRKLFQHHAGFFCNQS